MLYCYFSALHVNTSAASARDRAAVNSARRFVTIATGTIERAALSPKAPTTRIPMGIASTCRHAFRVAEEVGGRLSADASAASGPGALA